MTDDERIAACEAIIDDLAQKVALYEQALLDVLDPAGYIERIDEEQGAHAGDEFLALFVRDPNALKGIAAEALEKTGIVVIEDDTAFVKEGLDA